MLDAHAMGHGVLKTCGYDRLWDALPNASDAICEVKGQRLRRSVILALSVKVSCLGIIGCSIRVLWICLIH